MSAEKDPGTKKNSKEKKKSKGERFWKLSRNYNAIAAIAFAGVAAAIPGPNAILAAGAGINVAQSGGSEILRRRAKKKKKNSEKSDGESRK